MSAKFQRDELVNIAVYNARFESASDDVYYFRLADGFSMGIPRLAAHFERVAPKEWPPQPGDMWRVKETGKHFAVAMNAAGDVRFVDVGTAAVKEPDDLISRHELELMYRDGWRKEGA